MKEKTPNHIGFLMVYDDMEVIMKIDPDKNIHELYECFEQFCLAAGYSPNSIRELSGEREE